MRVQAQAEATGGVRQFPKQRRRQRERRCGGRHHHPAHRIRGVLVIPRLQAFNIADHLIQGFRLQRGFREPGMGAGGLQRTATAQHKTQAELIGHVEQQVARLGGAVGVVEVMVIGAGRHPRQQQFGHAQPCGDARQLRREPVEARVGHARQPALQILIQTFRHGFEQILEQVMVSVDPARIDHRMTRIDHPFAGLRFKVGRHFGDAAVDDPNINGTGPGTGAAQAGHHRHGVFDQDVLNVSHGRLQSEAV
ncbi:hypothetical protein D3C87_1322380 [compost metagenome]